MKILVVDDESFVREGIISNIPWKKLGIEEIFQARDGSEALSLAIQNHVDIVLSDIRMPGMDGIELITRLREKTDCKVIFMSAYTDKEYFKSAIKFHAVGYVEKPINLRELEAALEEAAAMILSGKTRASREESALRELKERNAAFWGSDDHSVSGTTPDQGEYIESFCRALLHDSPDTLDDSLTRTVLSLKETKSIDMDGAYSIFRKYAGILTEYAKTCAVPFDEDIQGSIKSISFIDTIEHCKTFIYERCRALSKTLKALPWQSMLVSKVGFIVELYYKDHNLYIPFICGMLGVGKSTLCDVYKAETGKTINEAIVQHRLEEACVLLRDSTLTIAEVSAETGFTDQNYFTRTFKHMFGVTPSIYRKRIIK